jgi:hypothetical protein
VAKTFIEREVPVGDGGVLHMTVPTPQGGSLSWGKAYVSLSTCGFAGRFGDATVVVGYRVAGKGWLPIQQVTLADNANAWWQEIPAWTEKLDIRRVGGDVNAPVSALVQYEG